MEIPIVSMFVEKVVFLIGNTNFQSEGGCCSAKLKLGGFLNGILNHLKMHPLIPTIITAAATTNYYHYDYYYYGYHYYY